MKKLVVKEKASSDVFTDLSRDMFDWQWPAVYKCSNLKAKTVDVSQGMYFTLSVHYSFSS